MLKPYRDHFDKYLLSEHCQLAAGLQATAEGTGHVVCRRRSGTPPSPVAAWQIAVQGGEIRERRAGADAAPAASSGCIERVLARGPAAGMMVLYGFRHLRTLRLAVADS